jgi:branched-chain amino acid aminotransferase
MAEPVIYVNGEFVPESGARISVLDHAVLYGDGIFETAFAWKGRVFKLDAHIDRGFRSMAAIALEPPMDREAMRAIILEAVRRNGFEDAYIKWLVTRGSNGKPLMDPTGCVPNLIVLVRPYINRASPERVASGLRLKTVAVRRPPGQILDAHIKSLNYLNLVLAKLEAKAAGADEALMLGIHGHISEATGCNIFLRHGARLSTPRDDILAGITRATVIELAPAAGYQVTETDLQLYDAYTADEVFVCSTAGGLLPVVEIDGRQVGDGAPGKAYRELASVYDALISSDEFATPVPQGNGMDASRAAGGSA